MKRIIDALPLTQPVPIVLIGTKVEDKVNFTTIGDIMIASINPPLITISLNVKHLATTHIDETKVLSINIPTVDMMCETDLCGVLSGHTADKSTIFDYVVENEIPYIRKSPINLFCNVVEKVQIKHRCIYILEVDKTYIEEKLIQNGTINLGGLNGLYYGLENRYYSLVSQIGEGYKEFRHINIKNDE